MSAVDAETVERPTLVQVTLKSITEACAHNGRKNQPQGDVLVVLDLADLTKTILLNSKVLRRHIPAFAHEHFVAVDHSADDAGAAREIKRLLVLVPEGEYRPALRQRELDEPAPEPESNEPEITYVHKSARAKAEPVDEDGTAFEMTPNCADWPAAYRAFFTIACKSRPPKVEQVGISKRADLALPDVEAVMAIADHYNALDRLLTAFVSFCQHWQSTKSLWAAVASEPVRWMIISTKLENELVYTEAFIHLAGLYPDFDGRERLPAAVTEALAVQASQLRVIRYEINEKLLTMKFMKLKRDKEKGKKSPHVETAVDPHDEPVIFNTLNVVRNWILDHIEYLSLKENKLDEAGTHISYFCKHTEGDECLTVAGFYRIISRGGDAYLPADGFMRKWNQKFDAEEARIAREGLAAMKMEARNIVAGLVASQLQYREPEKLAHLTCATVKTLPWTDEAANEDVEMD